MQIKKFLCLILCLIIILSSCAQKSEPEPQSTTAVTTTEEETTVALPSKLTNESTAIGDYGTVSGCDLENYKVFVNEKWNISKEFLECYCNPQNKEGYYKENRYGIADKNGNIIIEPQFGFIRPVAKDRFLVANGQKYDYSEFVATEYAVINSKGEIIIPFVPKIEWMIEYYDGLESNYFCVHRKKDSRYIVEEEKYYLADNNGNRVYDIYFSDFYVDHPMYKNEEISHVGEYDGKKYFFDKDLNITKILDENPIIDKHLTTYLNMEYSITVCYKRGKYCYGVINETTGKEIVPCKYEKITEFAENRILVSETRDLDNTKWIYAIYDFYGNVICPEGKYCAISIYEWEDDGYYIPAGIASAHNPNGDRIYGDRYEWLIDKNGTKISDTYCHIYYNQYGEMAGYYTADRGDKVFYLNKNGKVIGTIGQ